MRVLMIVVALVVAGCQQGGEPQRKKIKKEPEYQETSPYKEDELILPGAGVIQRIDRGKMTIPPAIATRCTRQKQSIYRTGNQFFWVTGEVLRWDKRYDNSLILAALIRKIDQKTVQQIPGMLQTLGGGKKYRDHVFKGDNLFFMGGGSIYICRIIPFKKITQFYQETIPSQTILKSKLFIRKEIILKSSSTENQ